MIRSYAEEVIAHADANGGSCRRGFVKNMVDAAAIVASALQITRLDINNDARRIRSKRQREVSFSESFALIEPSTTITACAASDTLSSMSSSAEEDSLSTNCKTKRHGMDCLLASAAAESNCPQLPNRCSYPGCGAPICLVQLDCSTPNCTGKVHPFCQVYAGASGCTVFPQPSEVKCRQCLDETKCLERITRVSSTPGKSTCS